MPHIPDLIYWRTLNGKKLRLEQLGTGRYSRLVRLYHKDVEGTGFILANRFETFWFLFFLGPKRVAFKWWSGASGIHRLELTLLLLALLSGAIWAAIIF